MKPLSRQLLQLNRLLLFKLGNASALTFLTLLSACSSPNEEPYIASTDREMAFTVVEPKPMEAPFTNQPKPQASHTTLTFKYDGFGPAHAPAKDGHYTYEYNYNGALKRKLHPLQGTETYKHNHHHKLSRVQTFLGDQFDYLYDASGNRVAKKLNNGEEVEKYFGGGIEKRNGKTLKFFFAGSKRLAEKDENQNLVFYHQDHLSSTSVVTNRFAQLVTKRTYYEFGAQKESFELHQADHDYNDKRLEKQTKLLDYHARQYAPSFFQFVQPDTIIPNATDPQSYNRFTYVINNPLKFIDPTGHENELPEYQQPHGLAVEASVGVLGGDLYDIYFNVRYSTDRVPQIRKAIPLPNPLRDPMGYVGAVKKRWSHVGSEFGMQATLAMVPIASAAVFRILDKALPMMSRTGSLSANRTFFQNEELPVHIGRPRGVRDGTLHMLHEFYVLVNRNDGSIVGTRNAFDRDNALPDAWKRAGEDPSQYSVFKVDLSSEVNLTTKIEQLRIESIVPESTPRLWDRMTVDSRTIINGYDVQFPHPSQVAEDSIFGMRGDSWTVDHSVFE